MNIPLTELLRAYVERQAPRQVTKEERRAFVFGLFCGDLRVRTEKRDRARIVCEMNLPDLSEEMLSLLSRRELLLFCEEETRGLS